MNSTDLLPNQVPTFTFKYLMFLLLDMILIIKLQYLDLVYNILRHNKLFDRVNDILIYTLMY